MKSIVSNGDGYHRAQRRLDAVDGGRNYGSLARVEWAGDPPLSVADDQTIDADRIATRAISATAIHPYRAPRSRVGLRARALPALLLMQTSRGWCS